MGRYPEIEPYESGLLDVGAGTQVYWETCGNPDGKPVLVVHGGPGSGCSAGQRRFFDPSAYRIVLFDQRGCGRSTPHASDPAVDLTNNNTEALVGDMERLRELLGITRWMLFGGSWGSVLSLVYAERHPERVTEIVLMGLATGRRVETDVLTRGARELFPEAWARFAAGVPEADREGDLADAYARLLADPDPAVQERAAVDWCLWEDAISPASLGPNPAFADPVFRMAFARLVTHYWRHGSWLAEGAVLRDAGKLAGIPGVLVQGSVDLANLVGTPWLLASAWPGSELRLIDDAGHTSSHPAMETALIEATDRFRGA
ncbi:proline iminopeptidase [Tamaricihabitans halophyticus]|uniref:Proline iminopeptidase n=1 Tax=Tamaricihabitans halophyticus TaxID=1262583 RepID=A0A4R2R350_9PSEU|nr:prolyl aminopeptidase [Tamaricihabitans halophyticus]TCP56447.1 proline iminopeptidase [Tamaricihabitans halophyticus]